MYLLAIIFPPLAVLIAGKPFQAIVNVFLIFFLWFPAIVHAIMVINAKNADQKHKELISAIKSQKEVAQDKAA